LIWIKFALFGGLPALEGGNGRGLRILFKLYVDQQVEIKGAAFA
jgi:hypothetical protein